MCLVLLAPVVAFAAQQPGGNGPQHATPSQEPAIQFMPQSGGGSGGAAGQAAYTTGNLTYHGGAILHKAANYLIFWVPPNYALDTPNIDISYPQASDANYEGLLAQYFSDLSNTPFYSILQQYPDKAGATSMVTSLGGSWVDTSVYPNGEGGLGKPLQDQDLQNEVLRAMQVNGWTANNGGHDFYVLTAYNAYSCADKACSFKDFCAYHSSFNLDTGENVTYADIPDPGNRGNAGSCVAVGETGERAPNSGAFADSVVNLVSHEEFETVTDPYVDGWFYQDYNHEIGDQCSWKFGAVASDGSNLVLNSHKYLVQEEWSNQVGGCYVPTSVPSLHVVADYGVQGGGLGYSGPTFTYFSNGALNTVTLSNSPVSLTVDEGTGWSVAGMLPGSTATERWFASQATSGVASPGATLVFDYAHQYYLSVQGGSQQSGWYNSGSQAVVTTPGVYGRSAGVGVRVNGYMLDGLGQPVPPSTGTVSATVLMISPHVLIFTTTKQYQVSLDQTAKDALSSMTPPTLSGDKYWYDSGTTVSVALFGEWGRASGTGYRLTSYAVDNGPPQGANSLGTVTVLGPVALNSPYAVSAASTSQYQLTIGGGHVLAATSPPIAGDAGWYDSGAQVSLTYDHSSNSTGGTRLSAVAFAVDGVQSQVARAGTGTFTEKVTMDQSHAASVASVRQYLLGVTGGSAITASPPSPTGDGYFDAGTSSMVSSNYSWSAAAGTRQNMVSYSIDGRSADVPRADSGQFTTAEIAFDGPHQVAFDGVTQYLVGFDVRNASGSGTVVPSALQLQTQNQGAVGVKAPGAWLDAGTSFSISKLVWEGVDVKPVGQSLTAASPTTLTVSARVFDATLKVADYLGVPVGGAAVTVQLANGTSVARTTPSSGTVSISAIPLGNYNATVSYLGAKFHQTEDASAGSTENVKVLVSGPDVAAILGAAAAIAIVGYLVLRRRAA